jgi:hypothetical protein
LQQDNNRDHHVFLNYAIVNKEPVEIEATRAGSTKKEKMVRYVSSYKVSVNKIEFFLWNKGLKSKGKFAGNAVDGFSSGNYTIQSMQLLPTYDKVCLFNDDCFDDGYLIELEAGLLEKTGDGHELGEFELNFKVDREERSLSFDKKKNEVSSASVSRYLRYLRRASNEVGEGAKAKIVRFGLSDGKTVVGEMIGLKDNNGDWGATVKLAFNDAEGLKNKTIVVEALFWSGVVPGPPGQRL